jgi:colicin import membrane protein
MDLLRRPHVVALAALAAAVSVLAGAPSSSGQGNDDHAIATALVHQLEQDAAAASIAAEAMSHSKDAFERATRLRGAGDESHAKAADGLAREWAESARDLARAADAEARAADVRRKAVDAQARLERARTLVEEGVARVGRLKSQLDEAGRAAPKDRTAAELHDGDAGARRADAKEKPAKGTTRGATP